MNPVFSFAAMTLLLCGCVANSTAPRDSGGVAMRLSEWQAIAPTDVIVNLADLGDLPDTLFDERNRDNIFTQQRIRFVDGRGQIFIEHLLPQYYVYSFQVTERCLSEDLFRNEIDNFFKTQNQTASPYRIDQIRKYGMYARRTAIVSVSGGLRNCVFGKQCFLSKGKHNPRTDERFDTAVRLRDCAGNWAYDDIKAWMQDIRIVPKDYKPGQG